LSSDTIPFKEFLIRFWQNLVEYSPLPPDYYFGSNSKGLFVFIIACLLVLFVCIKIAKNRRLFLFSIILVTLPPILYIILLKNYAFIHNFAVFKLSTPLIVFVVLLPLIVLEYDFKLLTKLASKRSFILAVCIFCLILSQGARKSFNDFAKPTNSTAKELGILVSKNIAENELPVSDSFSVNIEYKPFRHFYTNRLIYRPTDAYRRPDEDLRIVRSSITLEQLLNWGYEGKANLSNIMSMQPVYLEYSDKLGDSLVNNICQGYWHKLPEKYGDNEVSMCRSPLLKKVFLGSQ
jgi:hypothetical protein